MKKLSVAPSGNHKFFALLAFLLITGFFGFQKVFSSAGKIDHLVISEVQTTGGEGKTKQDFIEIYNPTDEPIDLKGYRLVKRTTSGKTDTSIKSFASSSLIKPGEYYLWANNAEDFDETVEADCSTSETISDDNGIALRYGALNTGEIIDSVGWGDYENIFVETEAFPENPGATETLSRKFSTSGKIIDSDDNSEDFVLGLPSPKNETRFKPAPPPPIVYSDQIRINELLPKPDPKNVSASEEFVELFNSGAKKEDLSGWFLEDRSGKKCELPKKEIMSGEFLIVKKDLSAKCDLALNDTQGEILKLFDPKDKDPISQSEYSGSPKTGKSYSFDGALWRWSQFLTPMAENIFNNLPTVSSKKENKIYTGAYADFSASGKDKDKDKLKYVWDFGDGHKSYLPKTRHKYAKAGKYTATLKVTDGNEDTLTAYEISVEDFPDQKIRIVAIAANPSGADTEKEYVSLKNESKKKVNLLGWSIATGWKDVINHPIRKKFEIKPGKTKNLTGKFSSFTLNNTQAKIELRDPAGNVVDKIKYQNKSGVPEGALYEKTKKKWHWALPIKTLEEKISEPIMSDSAPEKIPSKEEGVPIIKSSEVAKNIGKFSEDPLSYKKDKSTIFLLQKNYSKKITLPDDISQQMILTNTHPVRLLEDHYSFTRPATIRPHWLLKELDASTGFLNSVLNKIILTI